MACKWFPFCNQPPCNCGLLPASCGFEGAPSIYHIRVPTLTNDACANCDVWSGDFKLCYNPSKFLQWQSPAYSGTQCGHTAGSPLWQLNRYSSSSFTFYQLLAVGLGYRWTLPLADWSCKLNNTLALAYPLPLPGPCGSVPSEIFLRSCGVCTAFCVNGFEAPAHVQVEFSTIADGVCGCDPELMGSTFVLDPTATFPSIGPTICNWQDEIGNLPNCTDPGCLTTLSAAILDLGGADGVSWIVTLRRIGLCARKFEVRWKWSSGSSADIDCAIPRTLTLYDVDDPDAVCDWTGSTVTLTPV
jgi:hypothetical protein